MIVVCKCCMGTKEVREFNPMGQEIKVMCRACGGMGKWREGAEFTMLRYIALPILRKMALVEPWVVVDEANGKIMFHEGPGIPKDDEKLLGLLSLSSEIATHMEQHNWLVAL